MILNYIGQTLHICIHFVGSLGFSVALQKRMEMIVGFLIQSTTGQAPLAPPLRGAKAPSEQVSRGRARKKIKDNSYPSVNHSSELGFLLPCKKEVVKASPLVTPTSMGPKHLGVG